MSKTIFDHLKGVTKDKIPWDSLSDGDKSSWDDFMITRWLSMKPEYVEYLNELQMYRYSGLYGKHYYELLRFSLPAESSYFKYIKKPKTSDLEKRVIEFFSNVYQISFRESFDIMQMFRKLSMQNDFDLLLAKHGIQQEDRIELRKGLFNE